MPPTYRLGGLLAFSRGSFADFVLFTRQSAPFFGLPYGQSKFLKTSFENS